MQMKLIFFKLSSEAEVKFIWYKIYGKGERSDKLGFLGYGKWNEKEKAFTISEFFEGIAGLKEKQKKILNEINDFYLNSSGYEKIAPSKVTPFSE